MKLSDLAIKRPIATLMVVLLILLLGLVSLSRLSMDLLPNMSFPIAAVITSYEGVGPEEIENIVTKPLENVLGTVTNLKSISSISQTGQSLIILEFNWGTNMDFITLEIREKLDLIKQMLPGNITSPMVFKFDPTMLPIGQFGLTGIQDLVELKNLAETELIPRLERIDGVASAELTGGLTREIRIEVDQQKMAFYGLDLSTVNGILQMENLTLPAGRITEGKHEYLVRTTGELKSVQEIAQILLPSRRTGLIPLAAIAEVRDSYKEIREMARMNGQPSVGITIQKQADANTVLVMRKVLEEIENFEKESSELKIIPIMNQSEYIEESIGNVGRNGIFGGILAVLILFFFLRNVRSTLIIGTAIPISVIATFIMVYFSGLSVNLMTLGGLALGIGMLVDNSIVVLENIFRFRQQGLDRIDAAKKGTGEVAMAIIASTLTTIIVFLPVVFVEGIASQLFSELALTVTFSLLASLTIALTFIPMLSAQILTVPRYLMRREEHEGRIIGYFKGVYQKLLAWSVQHPWLVLGLAVAVFALSMSILPLIGTEFIPDMDSGAIRISVELPSGTVLSETEKVISQIEEQVLDLEDVESVFASVGAASNSMIQSATQPEVGEVLIKLKPVGEGKKTTTQIMEELRKSLKFITGVDLEVASQGVIGGGMFDQPIVIKITGPDLNVLKKLAEDVIAQIQNVKGVRNPEHSMKEGRPELQIIIDRGKAAQMGLQIAQVGIAVQQAVQGNLSTRYKDDGREYDLRVQLRWDDRNEISDLEKILIPSPLGTQIPLGSIAHMKVTAGPGLIQRTNGTRMIEVTANLFNRDLGSVNNEIEKKLAQNIALPEQYNINFGGQYREMWSAFYSLGFALILAVILVYMILAAQFESLFHPLTIMITVPLALTGAVVALYVSGYTISVLSIIGMIMLAGIVVNNAIVLVDYINSLREEGKGLKEAILEAGPVRLRPILMTSLTTVLGLLPLALGIGEGSETQGPLAVVVIGGLTFSTFLTLLVVPNIYIIFDTLSLKLHRIYARLQRD